MPSFSYLPPQLAPMPMVSATETRKFRLVKPWVVQIDGATEYPNGAIFIPLGFVTDGASIPFPWLLTFLSFGVMRPVGILFEAAIIHDFAVSHSALVYGDRNQLLTRTQADALFRDMVATKNPTVAQLAWWGLRFWALVTRRSHQ